jgi:hypothetical protein
MTCDKAVLTRNGTAPDSELDCDCCPQAHDHAGLGCRPVRISIVAPARTRPAR